MSNTKGTDSTFKKTFRPEDYVNSRDAADRRKKVEESAHQQLKVKLEHFVGKFIDIVFKIAPAERQEEMKFLNQCWQLQLSKVEHLIDTTPYKPKFNERISKWLEEQTKNIKKETKTF